MGGEIIVHHDQGNDYEVLLTLYRDTLGISIAQSQTLTLFDQNGNGISTIVSTHDLTAFHPIFGLQNGSLLPYFPYGVEVYFYSATITISNPGEYTIAWSNCCRNAAIINIPNASSYDMHLFTNFTVDPNQTGSTPYFMVRPIVYLPVNTPWQYNPLPFDPDGDSLVWSLDVPHESSATNLTDGTQIPGYTNPPSVSGGTFSIDPLTGTISWTASTLGNFVYTVTCEEYRNGVKIGDIRRDMQFVVLPQGPVPALMDLNTLSTLNGIPYATAIAGGTFDLNLFAMDSSVATIAFEAYGEPFIINNPMTYITGPTDDPFKTKISLMWDPTSNEVRPEPYLIVLRLMNGTFTMDYNLYILVVEPTYIGDSRIVNMPIYPNPSSGDVTVPVNLEHPQLVSLIILDVQGKIVNSVQARYPSGYNLVVLENNLPNGNYLVEIQFEDGGREVQQLIIRN